ncbi:MAG: PAS domain-containing protein [Alphaproteobacteria bacterium]|nr:PAS domain-containing protein [Alphaproteobacteria bacterium]
MNAIQPNTNPALLGEILKDSPIAVFVWDLSEGWPVTFVSEGINQFGYAPDDFLSNRLRYEEILFDDDVQRVAQEVAANLANRVDKFEQRYRIRTASGEIRWVHDWTTVHRDPSGKAYENHGTIIDITEMIEAEERNRRYLRMSGNMFLALDENGTVLDANERTGAVTGVAVDKLRGSDWVGTFIPKERRTEIREILKGLMAEDDSLETREFENDIRAKSGELKRVHWYFGIDSNANGGNRKLIAFGTDVTERRVAEQRAQAYAKFPLENPSPVLRVDLSGEIMLANGPAQQLMGHLITCSEQEREQWLKIIERAKSMQRARNVRLTLGERHYQFNLAPVFSEDYCNLYGQDITDQVERDARLEDIANSLPGAVFQYAIAPDGSDSINYMSPGCERIWELPRTVVERDPTPLWQMVHPDDIEDMKASVGKSMEALSFWSHDWRIWPKSGGEKWLRGMGQPRRTADGTTIWNSVILDVTEQKNASRSLSMALTKTVQVLAAALEARDPYTAGHEEHVARIAVQIGKKMGLDDHQLLGLELGAMIHDVGKIQIPSEILSKPSRLLDAEYELIKMHPETGAQLLGDIEFEWPIVDMIRQHHERIDGSGYPHGLKGDEITLEARIIAVADVFDAMATHRPYRPGLGIDAAAKEIREGAGTRYDPEIAQVLLDLIDADEIDIAA